MYSCGPPHMAKQKQDDQLEHTYSSYVRIRDVALKTCQKRWMIGRNGERRSEISVLAARHHDDDVYRNVVNLYVMDYNHFICLPTFESNHFLITHPLFDYYNHLSPVIMYFDLILEIHTSMGWDILVGYPRGWTATMWIQTMWRCYIYFQINAHWERYEHPYLPSYRLNSTTAVLQRGWLWP